MSIRHRDNSREARLAMDRAKRKALEKIGLAAVETTLNYMQDTGRYGPGSKGAGIWLTGDLQRDVSHRIATAVDDAVEIGNSLNYALKVHNGTRKMPARPYLRDALSENTDIWREIAAEVIGGEIRW